MAEKKRKTRREFSRLNLDRKKKKKRKAGYWKRTETSELKS